MRGLPQFYPVQVQMSWSNEVYEAHETCETIIEKFDGALDFAELTQLAPLILALNQAKIGSVLSFDKIHIHLDMEDKKKNKHGWSDLVHQKWSASIHSKGSIELTGRYGHCGTLKVEINDLPIQAYVSPDGNEIVIPSLGQTIDFKLTWLQAAAAIKPMGKANYHSYTCFPLPISKYLKILKYQSVLREWHDDTQDLQTYVANAIA